MNTLSLHSLALAALAAVSLGARSVAAQSSVPSTSPAPAAPQEIAPTDLDQQVASLIDRPGGLTADQAASRARAMSYEAQARRADSAAALQRVVQAELGFVPRVAARGTYTRVPDVGIQSFGNVVTAPGAPLGPLAAGGAASTLLVNAPLGLTYPKDNLSAQIEVILPISDYVLRVAKQYTSAKHSAKAAELLARATEAAASTNARLEYYAWARARLRELVALSVLDLASKHLADAKSSFAAGQASQADVMQVEAQRADRELLVARAQSAVVIEEDRLHIAFHDPPRASYEIGEPLFEPLTPLHGQQAFPALLDEALRRRPELRAMRATADGLRDEASQQTIGLLPKLDAFGSAQYANPNPRYFPPVAAWKGTWALGAMVSWTSVDAILAGTSANAAASRATSADAQANDASDGIREEVLQAFRGVREAELAIEATTRSLVAAEEAYRIRRALFRAAQATSTELSNTETVLTQARFAAIDARIELRMARARLVHATGRDVLD